MGAGGELAPGQPDFLRAALPVLAACSVVLATVTEPAGWVELALLVAAVALFVLWARWGLPDPVLTVGVLAAVVLAQLSEGLEASTFLVSVLAIAVTGWRRLGLVGGVSIAAMVATPVLIAAIQPGREYGWPVWIGGIVFPAFMGWAFRRQEELSAQLIRARRGLADQAVLEERRRIARDVHDLVGHGLSAMMLQVTSARHVLHRDEQAAEEALRSAEQVGRRSLHELRRTVALLRSDDDSGVAPPLPGFGQIGELVDAARGGGLQVDYQAVGDHVPLDPAVGLTLYRIAQESLANAALHAPRARTLVRTTVSADDVVLEVESTGPVQVSADGADVDRPHYGLRGMGERAEVVGGELRAGPTASGWLVRCEVPLEGSR